MDFLRELLKMKEGFMPDLESMTDQQLVDLCREIGEEDACKMDADGRLVNREQLIRDLQTGSIGDADIDTPMGPREDVDMSYDHVERDHDEAYEPDQQDVDHNEDAIRDDMGEQQPMEAYTNLRKSFNLYKPSFNLYKPVKMKKGVMQKSVKTTKENVDMEQARTMHRWREADLQHRDEDARAEVSVPREIDRTKHANALAVWNDSMQKQETLEMVWPKLVAAMQTIKESTYKKIPGSLGGKKVAKVLLKEDTIPVVKFKDPYNKLVTPAHGGLQKDVTNKSADKAIEDEIGDAGTKGMKKKDRPYMEKPRFRDWLTANMIFNMTRSGELAGNMKLGESKGYAGKHPKKIKSVAGQGRGKVSVIANDGTKHTVLAKDTGGAMPKVGELITKYISEGVSKKKISEAKQMCEWFARCKNPATGTTPHSILGKVPTCDRCHKFARAARASTSRLRSATDEDRGKKLGEGAKQDLVSTVKDLIRKDKKHQAFLKARYPSVKQQKDIGKSHESTKLKGAAHRRTEK